jgi:hypothetical protein
VHDAHPPADNGPPSALLASGRSVGTGVTKQLIAARGIRNCAASDRGGSFLDVVSVFLPLRTL